MSVLVGIEITDSECRAVASQVPDTSKDGAKKVTLRPVPVTPWIYRSKRGIESVHTRLNPRARNNSQTELIGSLKGLYRQTADAFGTAEPILAVIGAPGSYAFTQREQLRNIGLWAGFNGVGIVDMTSAVALECVGDSPRRSTVLSVYANTANFSAAFVEAGGQTCRGKTLEASNKCSLGGFYLACLAVVFESMPREMQSKMCHEDIPGDFIQHISNLVLSRNSACEDAILNIENPKMEVSVSGQSLSQRIQPILGELKHLIGNASENFSPEKICVASPIGSWPIICQTISEVFPDIPIVTPEANIAVGAIRFGMLAPPEQTEAPSEPLTQSLDLPSGGIEAQLNERVEQLEESRRELESQYESLNADLGVAYNRLIQMYRANGETLKAWDAICYAVKVNPYDSALYKHYGDLALDIVIGYFGKKLFSQRGTVKLSDLEQFIKRLDRENVPPAYLKRVRATSEYYVALYWIQVMRKPDFIRQRLKQLCIHNPNFIEAHKLYNDCYGRKKK